MNHNYDCHLCLVSGQAVPNITPLRDRKLKPREVILLVSPGMTERAEWLKRAIVPTGVKTSVRHIEDPWDIQAMQDHVLDVLAELEADGKSVVLNATGGTKPMSIAAYEVFQKQEHPVFYVHPQRDRVIWLYPASSPSHDLEDRIRFEAFLGVYGLEACHIDRTPVNSGHRQLTDELIADIRRWSKPLGMLNWYAQQAVDSLTVKLNQTGWSEVEMLAERFEMHSLLHLHKDKIIFPDEASRFFVNGGWFEEYVYAILFNLRSDIPSIHDYGRNIQVQSKRNRDPVNNEIDVAFLSDNRLHIIECKTRNMTREAGIGTEALYKLDTLKEMMGGLQAKAMLVSYQPLSGATKSRAADLGIECCVASQLKGLREKMKQWIDA